MTKGRIVKDEWYPVYCFFTELEEANRFSQAPKYTIELTEAEYKDLNRTLKKFRDWQTKLEEMYDNGGQT